MNLNGKTVDLIQLQAELATAGIDVTALGTAGDDLHTYDEAGMPIDLPSGAAAVIAAHVPVTAPPTRDERLLDAVDQAKAIVASGGFTETQAQKLAAIFDGLGTAITGR